MSQSDLHTELLHIQLTHTNLNDGTNAPVWSAVHAIFCTTHLLLRPANQRVERAHCYVVYAVQCSAPCCNRRAIQAKPSTIACCQDPCVNENWARWWPTTASCSLPCWRAACCACRGDASLCADATHQCAAEQQLSTRLELDGLLEVCKVHQPSVLCFNISCTLYVSHVWHLDMACSI